MSSRGDVASWLKNDQQLLMSVMRMDRNSQRVLQLLIQAQSTSIFDKIQFYSTLRSGL